MIPQRYIRRLEALIKRQAKVRDDLRDFNGEIESLLSDNEEAAENLAIAADALSRLA